MEVIIGTEAVRSNRPAWWRLYACLMPDYNRKAAAYWWLVVSLGAMIIVRSAVQLQTAPSQTWLQILLCTVLAMLAGLAPVRVPKSNNSFTAGEIFIFLLLLVSGPEAAAIASACEALIGSWRTSKRWTSRIASPAMAAIALYAAGSILTNSMAWMTVHGFYSDGLLLGCSILFALAYFLINTLLVTTVPRLKRDEPFRLASLLSGFGWLGIAYAANASVAAFLFLTFRQSGVAVVLAAVPVIAILLSTGHYFFRRKEADESVRAAKASEIEHARQHVVELQLSEQRFHDAFTHASIGMALVSPKGDIRQTNASLRAFLGLADVIGGHIDFTQFVSKDGRSTLAGFLARFETQSQNPFAGDFRFCHPSGRDVWVEISCSLFSDAQSHQACLILQVQDITVRQQALIDLHHVAFHDGLTGLPNRQRFNERLKDAIRVAASDPSRQFGVMFLDFDRFKLINDSWGHTVGDQFLIQASRRIEDSVRNGDIVARLGGDEFAILVEDRGTPRAVVQLADRLQKTLAHPFSVGGTDVKTSASMGITFSSFGYSTPDEVLRDADIAMYKAKAAGKACYALFDVSLHEQISGRLRLEGELRKAIEEDGMSVDYQPLFDLQSGRLVGFEALARWRHPDLGSISPARFIPIAEESGSIVQLTDFMLTASCMQLQRWQEISPIYASLKMHINVSANDMAAGNLLSRVACALVQARLRPENISIELTENILMERLEAAMGTLNELHELGVGLSVDDFGTGYSSLSHLSTLPIDCLKIDRSFVADLKPNSKEAAVIRAIVLLGKSLGKEVIAEGIETAAQLDELRTLGCDVGQGYLLARPQSVEAIDALLQSLLCQGQATSDACEWESLRQVA